MLEELKVFEVKQKKNKTTPLVGRLPGRWVSIAYFVIWKAFLLYDCKTVTGISSRRNPCHDSMTNGSSVEGVREGRGGWEGGGRLLAEHLMCTM